MAFLAKVDIFKITEMRDDCIYRTQYVTSIWIECKQRTAMEEKNIAKQFGGDIWSNTVISKFVPGKAAEPYEEKR